MEFLTKVSGENQEVTPVSPGTALSIHSGSSGLRASGPRPPTLLSVRTPSVYSFVGSGVPSHGQADAGLNDCNGAASASSVPARSRVSTRGLALRVKGPSSSASLVTPSVHTQVSRFGTRRSLGPLSGQVRIPCWCAQETAFALRPLRHVPVKNQLLRTAMLLRLLRTLEIMQLPWGLLQTGSYLKR